MNLLLRWIASAAAVGVAAWLLPGIEAEGGFRDLFAIALILGFANAVVRPLLRWLSCGLIVLTLGLFLLVINALMLLLAETIGRVLGFGFSVDGFASAFIGSAIISMVSFLLSLWISDEE